MEEAVEEDAYPPSLCVVVTQHYPPHRYTATKQAHLTISETDLGTLILPVNVMEVEGHPTIGNNMSPMNILFIAYYGFFLVHMYHGCSRKY